MQVCTLHQKDNHASTPPLSFFTGRMPFLPPNQQRQSTEGLNLYGQVQKYQAIALLFIKKHTHTVRHTAARQTSTSKIICSRSLHSPRNSREPQQHSDDETAALRSGKFPAESHRKRLNEKNCPGSRI